MLIESNSVIGMKCRVYDIVGKLIGFIKSYDTITKEAEVYVISGITKEGNPKFAVIGEGKPGWQINPPGSEREVATAKCILEGSYAEIDGKRVS